MSSRDPVEPPQPANAPPAPGPAEPEVTVLSRGRHSEVVRVHDPERDAFVVEKRPWTPAGNPRLLHEARQLDRLDHPGVPAFLGLDPEPDGRLVLRMGAVPGDSLEELLARTMRAGGWRSPEQPWSPRRLLSVLTELARLLASAHAAGVVHADLKPEHVHVQGLAAHGTPDRVHLIDWGNAGEPGGAVLGWSPPFSPREQTAGARLHPAMDVYAWGRLTVHLLRRRHLPPGAPRRLVERCLSRNTKARPSAEALARALGDAGF